jgi:RNA polymerase sigma factor (sigma-70 family)
VDVSGAGDEAATWARAIDNDSAAFATLFDLHRHRVYRHARLLLSSDHDAEDVAAAAFFELWRRRSSVRVTNGSVLPWLLVTTTNLARNSKRAVRRYQHLLASLPRTTAPDHVADEIVDRVDAARETDPAWVTIRKLSARDGTLLALISFGELSIAEAAEVLGISDGAARTRLHRARQKIALDGPASDVLDAVTEEAR